MSPQYLYELADLADPDQLWRLRGLDQMDLSPEKRKQLDAGVALRRYASHVSDLRAVLDTKRSLLITPLSPNSSTRGIVETPANHERLRQQTVTTEHRFDALIEAARALLAAVDAIHDTEPPPRKYRVPYGAVNALREAVAGTWRRARLTAPRVDASPSSDPPA